VGLMKPGDNQIQNVKPGSNNNNEPNKLNEWNDIYTRNQKKLE